MNQGGEPGHDDYGLPRVDIEIPDDARELDRDVQAYYRELRALRRQQRSRRWRAPLRRSGLVMPLIAGFLLVTMLAGMVLTMFGTDSYISGLTDKQPGVSHSAGRGSRAGHRSTAPGTSARRSPAAPARPIGASLPNRTITVAGRAVSLRTFTSVAFAIVPATCRCAVALGQLVTQAKTAGVPVYLIGWPGNGPAIASLMASAGRGTAIVASDSRQVLAAAYHPVGLTVLLVDYRGAVTVASRLVPGLKLARQLAGLRHSAR